MEVLKFTLIGDGSSDKALMNIIKWLFNDVFPTLPIEGSYADFRTLPNPPLKKNIQEQIKFAEKYYPFHILFYHRDAESSERAILNTRKAEILDGIDASYFSKIICVIPIVMMETWLLIDDTAIKKAAGNRNYNNAIVLPVASKLENIRDSKMFLHELLKETSGLKKRNLKTFNEHKAVHLVSENIRDYSILRQLHSFTVFENDFKTIVNNVLRE
jgi:hypothetical protein